jgi:nucleoid-associated protein YgaU
MKKLILFLGTLGLLAAALSSAGCAAKKVDTTEVPKAPESQEAAVVPTPTEAPEQKYEVVKGDCLWSISGKSEIYGDFFQWPLIFKANRDQIADPDQISPGQDFSIPKGQTPNEIQRARQLASDTPKFIAHVNPRNPLPIDYF